MSMDKFDPSNGNQIQKRGESLHRPARGPDQSRLSIEFLPLVPRMPETGLSALSTAAPTAEM
jgi:hypothetical protein